MRRTLLQLLLLSNRPITNLQSITITQHRFNHLFNQLRFNQLFSPLACFIRMI